MKPSKLLVIFGVGVLGALLPQARADQWNQRTNITFSGPVEIPGRVLNAGTYVFKLADSQSDRNIVQVFSKDQKHLYGTFLTIPDYRLRPTGKTIVTFDERASGAPEAVKAWFYPGDNYGHEFVFPKTKALALAKANNTAVPSMPDEMAANTAKPASTMKEDSVMAMKQTPLKAQKPSQEEVEITEVFPVQNNSQSSNANNSAYNNNNSNSGANNTLASNSSSGHTRPVMPKTASPLPLMGLLGLLSLGGAMIVRRFAIS